MHALIDDLRFALRGLRRTPGFALVAVLTLALGIGANTAVFSVVNAVLLRALPYHDAERLVVVWETVQRETVEQRSVSYLNYVDWRSAQSSFEELAAVSDGGFTLSGGEVPERIQGELVTASYFPLLGLSPVLGRALLLDSARQAEDAASVVVSHGLWQRQFGGDPNVLGQSITLNNQPFTIVGVMAPEARGITDDVQLWVPLSSQGPSELGERGDRWLQVVARLRPGATLERAQADMDAVSRRLAAAYPETNRSRGAEVVPLRQQYFGELRPALIVLLVAVAFVLLIACANIANLLLARGAVRAKEIAIRSALGAGRGRIARQFLTESVLLSLIGGVTGVILAAWGIPLLLVLSPLQLPEFVRIELDGQVLAFTLGLSLLTGLVFGAAPALAVAGRDRIDLLREGGRGSGSVSGRHRARTLLVGIEVAVAVVLLVGAGLMFQSFRRIVGFDPGFATEQLLTMRLRMSPERYNTEAARTFHATLLDRVSAIPSVRMAGVASDVPLSGSSSAFVINIEGRAPQPPYDGIRAYRHTVSPGFFKALGTPLVAGREFTWQDTDTLAPAVIVSAEMAKRYWPDADPIGKRLKPGPLEGDGRWHTVVGVVGNVKHRELLEPPTADPDLYLPIPTYPSRAVGLIARTNGEPEAVVAALRREISALDREIPLWDIATMNERAADQRAEARFSALLLVCFACLALVLASVGIYGVISYSVAQRTHEMGVRMALGAGRGDVLRLVLRQGMAPPIAGLVVGLLAAAMLTRLMRGLLYEVSPTDPVTFAAVASFLGVVALLATYVPGRRVTRVDPVVALKNE